MARKMTSREFNQDTGAAKRLAEKGPVIITDRGRPSHVLLTFDQYRKLSRGAANIIDLLAMPAGDDIEFEPARAGGLHRSVDLA